MGSSERFFGKRFIVFVFFGGLNTAVTYVMYLLLSSIMHYQVAYFIAYASGILLAYVVNLLYVFKSHSSVKKIVKYPVIYVIQYFLGAIFMYFLLDVFLLPNVLAPLLVAVLLLPTSYYMNRKVLDN